MDAGNNAAVEQVAAGPATVGPASPAGPTAIARVY
jgi:hypothetical protein